MNRKTYSKIASAATFLMTDLAIECKNYLASPLRLALDILEVIVINYDRHHKPAEIAQYLIDTNSNYSEKGLNSSTVQQVLQALREGSAPVASIREKGWYLVKQ